MNVRKTFFGGLCVLGVFLIAACGSENQGQATLDTSRVQSILPTIPPAQVAEYAELADEAVLARGETLYNALCAACHGIDGEGQFPESPMVPDSTGRIGAPPHDGNGHTWHHDDDLLIRYILEGGQGDPSRFYPMPGFAETVTEQEAEAILAYIKTMWSEEQRLIQAERTLLSRAQTP